MSDAAWFKSFFGEDYFEIYRDAFPAEHTAAQVDGIVSLLGLDAGARILDLACGHGRHAIPLAKRGFSSGRERTPKRKASPPDGFVATCASCPSTASSTL